MNEPTPLRHILTEQARRWGMDRPLESVRLFRSWEAVVGERVALRCQPVSLREGVLKVRTASAAWAAELRYLAPMVVQKVNRELGAELVEELKVTLLREPSGSGSRREVVPRPKPAASPGTLAGRGLSEAEALCSAIPDERLAEAARRALAAARPAPES